MKNNELARRLCAAFLSYQMGIGIEYAYKNYVAKTPGEFWQALSAVVLEQYKAWQSEIAARIKDSK